MVSIAKRAVAAAVGAAESAVNSFTASTCSQTVIMALDASEIAEYAMHWYIDRLHRHGNRIVFVHCVEVPESKLHQNSTDMTEEERMAKALELKVKEVLKEKGIVGVFRTSTGKPGEVIVKIAEEEGADMIVTGTRGMGKVRRTILGSVSDYLVHHAHCPVIVCRHPETGRRNEARCRNASGDTAKNTPSRGMSLNSDADK